MNLRYSLLALTMVGALSSSARADDEPWQGFDETRIALVAGLIQPILLRGGNVELDVNHGRFVAGYSHGFSLDMQGSTVVGDARDQGLAFHLPYSTGLSVGYRFTDWFDVRLEGKVHRFEARDEASGQSLFAYTTVTLGIGAYAQYRPFRDFGLDFPRWLQGFVVIGSVRYWPRLWSSLPSGGHAFQSPNGQEQVHQPAEIGIANTPFIVNLALGYAVEF